MFKLIISFVFFLFANNAFCGGVPKRAVSFAPPWRLESLSPRSRYEEDLLAQEEMVRSLAAVDSFVRKQAFFGDKDRESFRAKFSELDPNVLHEVLKQFDDGGAMNGFSVVTKYYIIHCLAFLSPDVSLLFLSAFDYTESPMPTDRLASEAKIYRTGAMHGFTEANKVSFLFAATQRDPRHVAFFLRLVNVPRWKAHGISENEKLELLYSKIPPVNP